MTALPIPEPDIPDEREINNNHLNGKILPFVRKPKLAKLSDKQLSFIKGSNAPINIAHGGVRGGKNFAIDVRLIRYFKEEPANDPDALFGIIGATKATVKRNVLSDLRKIVGRRNFTYNSQTGEGTLFGRPFQVFDYKDAKSIEKLRGCTLGGAMITECSFCPQEIFDEVIRRLTDDDAKLFIDTNPDNPYHWLFTDYINNEEKIKEGTVKVWHFTYRDNLSLGEGYIKKILSIFRPGTLKYQRFVEGLWVAGEGLIFDNFEPGKHSLNPEQIPEGGKTFLLPIDPGTFHAFAALKIKILEDKYYIYDEYYYDSQVSGKQKTESEYCVDMAKFSKGTNKPTIYIDPSRASFEVEMKKNLLKNLMNNNISINHFVIKHAFNDRLKGIDICNTLFNQDKIFISTKCRNLLQQISNYVWDKRAAARGIEEPLKVMDHTCDAFRYGIASHFTNMRPVNNSKSAGYGKISHNNYR